MTEKILIIDDDEDLTQMLVGRLSYRGYEVYAANNGLDGLRLAYRYHPDLVILDLMMPEMDVFEVCSRLRELSDVPILILSAKDADDDVIKGFQLGADDYISKPFRVWELESRLIAIMKRTKSTEEKVYDDGVLQVNLLKQQVSLREAPIHLTPTEFRLLGMLLKRRDTVVEREELLDEVWGEGYQDAKENLAVYIHYLRRKLRNKQNGHQYIRSRWGVGYWFATRQDF
ncbi:MAG: response regulator transcription factor [Anaerolineales bacterium]